MMKKLGIVVMTGLFSISVAGLSFADEKKSAAPAPANPCAGAKKEEPKKKAAAKKVDKKAEEAPTPAPTPTPAPAAPAKK